MMLELINEMENALKGYRPGLFTDLIRNGLIDTKHLFYREVFLYFGKEKVLGNNVSKSVMNTSVKFEMTEDNVYKIIRKFK